MKISDTIIDNISYQSELRELLTVNGKSVPRRFRIGYLNTVGKPYLADWIVSIYPECIFDFGDSCKAILNKIFSNSQCETCGDIVTSWAKQTNSWRRFCSDHCRNTNPNISEMKKAIWTPENKISASIARKKHYMEKHRVEHNMQIQEVAIKSGLAIKASRALRSDSDKEKRGQLAPFAYLIPLFIKGYA